MPEQIEIRDTTEAGYLACDLTDLLRLLDNGSSKLVWSVLELEAWSHAREGLDVLHLERRVRESPQGLILTWRELRGLAVRLGQIINGAIVGCRERELVPGTHTESAWFESCEIVIQVIDSTYWSVYAKDGSLLDKVKERFRSWRTVESGREASRGTSEPEVPRRLP